MKILRLVSSGFEEGGVETGIVMMRPLLEARGHEVRVLASDARPDLPHFNQYTFRAPGSWKPFHTFNPSAYRAMKQVLAEWQPDVVHLHTIGAASPSVLFALGGTPTVATVHGPEGYTRSLMLWNLSKSDFVGTERSVRHLTARGRVRYAYYRWVNYPLFRLGLRNVDRFVTLSSYMQSLMRGEDIESECVPNAVELFEYRPLRAQHIVPSIFFAGRLEAFKGVEYLVRALPIIHQRYPGVRLRVAGDGTERASLEALAASLGVRGLTTFVGGCNRAHLQEEYARASVVVMPSVWPEAFGKVGVEAMSVGRPVVAADVGGIRDWLRDGENGMVVPPADAWRIAKACVSLFKHPSRMCAMGEAGRHTAEGFTAQRHVERMERIYAEVIAVREAARAPTTCVRNSSAMRET